MSENVQDIDSENSSSPDISDSADGGESPEVMEGESTPPDSPESEQGMQPSPDSTMAEGTSSSEDESSLSAAPGSVVQANPLLVGVLTGAASFANPPDNHGEASSSSKQVPESPSRPKRESDSPEPEPPFSPTKKRKSPEKDKSPKKEGEE